MIVSFSIIEVFNDSTLGFKGNTAAVVKLEKPLSEKQMQEIAADFNQPATAFIWSSSGELSYHIRWYAPDSKIGLCGHGSLAAIAALSEGSFLNKTVRFNYGDGELTAMREDNLSASISLDPISVTGTKEVSEKLKKAIGKKIEAHYITNNKDILVLGSEEDVKTMKPNFALLRELESFGYSITAKGNTVDFVSRTIIPFVQQLEDPATGSSHASLAPYWASKLGKQYLVAHQLSKRGGLFNCDLSTSQVKLSGNYRTIAEGQLSIKA